MTDLLITIAIFIIAHMVPAVAPLRRALVSLLGRRTYIVGFSLISLGLLGWVGVAYFEAPYVELWAQAPWMRWAPVVLMAPACILLVAVFTHPNPLSVALRSQPFDPSRPGMVAVTRHPLLWALVLWASGHAVVNGDAASLIVFGLFAVLGAAGVFSIDARKKTKLGGEVWARLAATTSFLPFGATLTGHTKLGWNALGWGTLAGALVLYGTLLWAHPWVIGVSPLP